MTNHIETSREQELTTSLHKHEGEENRPAMAVDCYRLGAFYQEMGRLKASEAMFRRALVLCEALKDSQGVAAAYSKLGLLHEMYGDIGQARFYLEQAREIHDVARGRPGPRFRLQVPRILLLSGR